MCAVKHTRTAAALKPVTLVDAMDRIDGLTQQGLEDASGIDRTWIAKLRTNAAANPTIDTYEKLDAALRRLGGLRRGEKLVFGQRESLAS